MYFPGKIGHFLENAGIWMINHQSSYLQSILKYNLLGLHSKNAVLVRDKLFINGSQYFVDDTDEATHVNRISYRDSLLATPKEADRPYKRQRRSDSSPLVTGNAY